MTIKSEIEKLTREIKEDCLSEEEIKERKSLIALLESLVVDSVNRELIKIAEEIEKKFGRNLKEIIGILIRKRRHITKDRKDNLNSLIATLKEIELRRG